jgi:hypothetical protein
MSKKESKMAEEKLEIIDFSKKLKPYENMWVALSRDKRELIHAEKTLGLLLKRIKKEDFINIEFMKVPEFGYCFAP